MAKNIVICSDGTGNSAVKDRGTNVFKLYEAVDLNGHRGDPGLRQQVALYDDGVGSQGLKPVKALAGALGWGLSRNVRELYAELVRVYDPGDKLYLFGFSRGAFTVRTLAGLISEIGVLDREKFTTEYELRAAVKVAYKYHRRHYQTAISKLFRKPPEEGDLERFRKEHSVFDAEHCPEGVPSIDFIGVWDTVDAVGFPADFIADMWNTWFYRFKFPDTTLSPRVKRACHAISIDDERHTFHPVLWNERGESGRIEQVWFAGVHSNVGGGYPKQGMSLVPLLWMMNHAGASGLRFVRTVRSLIEETRHVSDTLYDSRAGLGMYYRFKPRDIAAMCRRCEVTPKIHMSVVERIAQGTDGYAPGNLPPDLVVVPDGNEEHARHAEKTIRAALGRAGSLQEATRNWVRTREASHYLFTAASIVALTLAWLQSGEPVGNLLTLGGAYAVGKAALEKPLLVAVCVVFWALGWWCTRQTYGCYSQFWYGLRPKLRVEELRPTGPAAQGHSAGG